MVSSELRYCLIFCCAALYTLAIDRNCSKLVTIILVTSSIVMNQRIAYEIRSSWVREYCSNHLAPNDVYIRRNTQLTSRRCILNIYSTNILIEYIKHAAHSPFFFSSRCRLFHNANFFGSCNIHILNTGWAKI